MAGRQAFIDVALWIETGGRARPDKAALAIVFIEVCDRAALLRGDGPSRAQGLWAEYVPAAHERAH